MPVKPRALLLFCLVIAMGIVGCDDDEGEGGDNTIVPPVTGPVDLSAFRGAWMIRTTSTPSFRNCPSMECQDRLQSMFNTYFAFAAGESACVRVDSLQHLVLVEPFMSQSTCTGNADAQGTTGAANVVCTHTGELLGDSLITSIDVDVFTVSQGAEFFADFELSATSPGDTTCGCVAAFGLGGRRRASDICGL